MKKKIILIDHSKSIRQRHVNKSQLHLNYKWNAVLGDDLCKSFIKYYQMTAEKIYTDDVGCNDEHVCNSPYTDNLKFICKDNPFLANVPILYPLKTPENMWFSGVFRRYKIGTFARNGLKKSIMAHLNMWCVARFGTIWTIWKTWKKPIKGC